MNRRFVTYIFDKLNLHLSNWRYDMKLFNIQRTSFVLILSACVFSVLGTTMNVTVSAEEQLGCVDDFVRAELKIEVEAPQSLEELFLTIRSL